MSYNHTGNESGKLLYSAPYHVTETEIVMTEVLTESSDQIVTSEQNFGSTQVKARNISIKPQDFGYLVNIGCQSFAISKLQDLMIGLEAYLTDPSNTENQWFKGEYKIGE